MARIPLFNSPLMLGFEQFERTLDQVSKSAADGYPPYNIEQTSDESLRITLAVAGFADSDLSIRLEDNQLVIQGRQAEDDDRVYLHRGIAGRQFQRTFVLAEGIEVIGAETDNGLLHIELRQRPPKTQVRTIEIGSRQSRRKE